MKYIKQLDSIRAIAVLLVIIEHWVSDENSWKFIINGAFGVNIFFVLSGFLITTILLENRLEAGSGRIGKSVVIKNFYIRRSLRIFPIYYLVILFLLIFHKSSGTNIKLNLGYFLTYTSNFYFYKIQAWDGILSHLWSLAVEEQFYVFWPFIILFVPVRYLLHTIIIFIMAGIISQHFWNKTEFDNTLVIFCLDSFGMGAILSWVVTFKQNLLPDFFRVIFPVGAISSAILFLQHYFPINSYFSERTLHSIVALWVITYIILKNRTGQPGFKFILNNRVLIFLGKISYGIYLYHLILPRYTFKYLTRFNNLLVQPGSGINQLINFLENFLILVLFAWLSWKIIEQPVLKLKKYFNYSGKPQLTAS